MKQIYKIITLCLISIVMMGTLTGCSDWFSSDMPSGSVSMQHSYTQAMNGSYEDIDTSLDTIRHRVRSQEVGVRIEQTRTPWNAIDAQFKPMKNPNIVMYVYPHMANSGANQLPVPGYSTVFPLYTHTYYE